MDVKVKEEEMAAALGGAFLDGEIDLDLGRDCSCRCRRDEEEGRLLPWLARADGAVVAAAADDDDDGGAALGAGTAAAATAAVRGRSTMIFA